MISSCTDNLADIGANIQPSNDDITIGTAVFPVTTENLFLDRIKSNPIYFLLGNYTDKKYGSTKAEILAQLESTIEPFAPNTVIDDAELLLAYQFQGDTLSPIQISVYEINKKTFGYNDVLYSDTYTSSYCDKSVLLGNRLVTKKNHSSSSATDTIQIKLSSEFATKIFKIYNDIYSNYNASQNDSNRIKFLEKFKGLYLTTDFGASTMLSLSRYSGITLRLHTHYTDLSGKNTVKINRDFVANDWVRETNCISHYDKMTTTLPKSDSCYISSPSNSYIKINIPLKSIKDSMNLKLGTKKQIINKALLKVEVLGVNTGPLAQPLIKNLLLIKTSSKERIFENKELPSDTCSLLGKLTYSQIGLTGKYEYFYSFDLAKLISKELKFNLNATNLEMELIPVELGRTGIYINAETLGAISVKSGNNNLSKMRIKMVYSGF